MESFRCPDSSHVIATQMMTNSHLNTTVVAIFPNVCLWRRSLCSDLVLTLKNCIEPPSYARTAYVVAIWPSFLFDSFVKIWATCEIFLGKWFTAPPGKKIPVRLWLNISFFEHKRQVNILQKTQGFIKPYFRLLYEYLAFCDVVSSDLFYLLRRKDRLLNS